MYFVGYARGGGGDNGSASWGNVGATLAANLNIGGRCEGRFIWSSSIAVVAGTSFSIKSRVEVGSTRVEGGSTYSRIGIQRQLALLQ